MKLIALSVLLLAFSGTEQTCGIGCLKCDSSSNCVVPDISQGYVLKNNQATKSELTNCALLNPDSTCAQCAVNYYLEASSGKCTAVPTANLVTNCSYYSNISTCSVCASGYYIDNTKCTKVNTPISFCSTYTSATVCSSCNANYILALDSASCVPVSSVTNCSGYNYVTCKSCSSDYYLNNNSYLSIDADLTTTEGKQALADYARDVIGSSDFIGSEVCLSKEDTNCTTFAVDSTTCTACNENFYLNTSGECVAYPTEPIPNCAVYTNATTCNKCNVGFLLQANTCKTLVSTDANCATFDNSASTATCQVCKDGYFLKNTNNTIVCTARTEAGSLNILHCAEKDADADTCSECDDKYNLTNDGLECQPDVTNCDVTAASAAKGGISNCTDCSDGYYIKQLTANNVNYNGCEKGTVDFCATYSDAGITCSVCLNKYYKSGNTCVAQTTIDGCTTYSQAQGQCAVCTNASNYTFALIQTCQNNTDLIDGCATYGIDDNSDPECETCIAGKHLYNNTCVDGVITNCLEYDSNAKCTKCASGFVLNVSDGNTNSNTSCVAPLSYVVDNCFENNSSSEEGSNYTTKSVRCNICNANAVPLDFEDQFACMTSVEAIATGAPANFVTDSCIKYDSDFDCIQCDPSKAKKYLLNTSGTYTCETSCTNGYYLYTLTNATDAQIESYNVCADTSNNCAVHAEDLSTNNVAVPICISCNTGFVSVLSAIDTASYSNADPTATANSWEQIKARYIPSPNARYPAVTCVANASVTQVNNAVAGPITDCAYYLTGTGTNGSPNYTCAKCKHKYNATIASNNITACNAMLDACNTNTTYYGLDAFINNIASCHKCGADNVFTTIPFVAYVSTSATSPAFKNWQTYTYTVDNNFAYTNTGTERNVVCRTALTPPTGYQTGTRSWDITAGCAIAAILVGNPAYNVDNTNIGHFCAACAPGYASTNNAIIKTCTEIANCPKTGTLFNGCSACSPGFLLGFTSDNVNFKKCVTATAANYPNCYAVNYTTDNLVDTATTCAVCSPGYTLNEDNVCEQYATYSCVAANFRVNQANATGSLNWSLYANGAPAGCNQCSGTNVAVEVENNVCVISNHVQTKVNTLLDDNTNYIPNCLNYDATNPSNLKCAACAATHTVNGSVTNGEITITGDTCYSKAQNANCAIALSDTNCLECTDNTYALVNSKCTANLIANCSEYEYQDNDNATAICTKCNQDYYLDENICKLGQISNCVVLVSENKCNECATGYGLLRNGNLTGTIGDICFPLPTIANCSQSGIGKNGQNFVYGCVACTNTATQIPTEVAAASVTSTCLSYPTVNNCLTYNANDSVANTDFTCDECNSGFYLANNKCVSRTNTSAKCSTYVTDADECDECDSTSYLSGDGKTCINNPAGIYQCSTYSNPTTCTACKTGYYLANNICNSVGATTIAGCVQYSSATTCTACNSSSVLTNNTCQTATASNCATYASITACATCQGNLVLKADATDATKINCTAISKTGCATYDIKSPNNCLSCNSGFYLNNGACSAATAITNCKSWATATTCAVCNSGYVLNAAKTGCVNTATVLAYADDNCADSQLSTTPVCSRCSAGRYFVNGACTGTCSVTGCLACNPSSASTCLICNTGYYQDSTGKCNAISSNTDDSASIFGVLSAVLMVIAVMIK